MSGWVMREAIRIRTGTCSSRRATKPFGNSRKSVSSSLFLLLRGRVLKKKERKTPQGSSIVPLLSPVSTRVV